MEQFCPIVVCNLILKIITKILVGRIKALLDSIISPSQVAFIPGRSMNDNIIVSHEIMHHMNKKKGNLSLTALKFEMAKAYGVEWSFLYSLINRSPFGNFCPSRGLSQGDLISPTFFTLIFYVLSRIFSKAESEGHLHGIKVCRESIRFSHLIAADELTIHCHATPSCHYKSSSKYFLSTVQAAC